uniref:Uncharacterized protein n=1 Tax=Poecilia reticulata TaxID=8081 RepID=A0A3P9PXD3_POERE
MVKYDGFDCVYGIELFKDNRVSNLQVLAEKVGEHVVVHLFLYSPIMTHWYYITYEKDPVLYMYQLWDDYKDGDLRVLPESENKHLLPADRKPGEEPESLVGKQVEYVTDNGLKRTGLVIYQVPYHPKETYFKWNISQ